MLRIRAGVVRLAVAVCLCAVAAPGAHGQTASTGIVAGAVQARATGQPVANAVVVVEGMPLTAVANAVGRFRLENVPAGRAVVVVRADGFLERRVPDVQVQPGVVSRLELALEATPNFLERVQVTATKEPLSIGDVAAQTDVVDRATIERRGDQTLTQAIAHVPGAIVSTQLGIFESVMLRGLPRGDPEFTNTLLLIDGVPQTTSTNGSRVVGLTINDASDIEIVRGPNSALYGRTAIGGSVNLRTADPTPQPQFGVDFTGGQFGTLKGVAHASGPIGQWGGYYASIGKERNTGFFNTRTGGDFSVGNTAAFGKLTFVPDAKSFGSISVNRIVSDNSTPTNEPVIDGQPLHILDPRFDRLTNFNIPGPNYHQGEGRLTLNYTRQLAPWARLVEVFGYRSVEQQFIDDGDFIFTDPDNEGFPINYLDPVIPPRSEWQHDVQPTRTYHLGITGLFAQYRIEPTRRWVLGAGGRYDRMALDNTPEGGPTLEAAFDAFSPKASATFKLLGADGGNRPTLNVYSAYSHAFLPPRRPSGLTPANVSLNLRPEDIDNLEGGVKGSLLGGRVSLEGTYFWMREDGVVLSRRQGPFFFPTNAGQQRYKGVETGIGAVVTPLVSAYTNAAFYRNRFGEFVIQTEDGDEALTGNRLPISPEHVVNWGLTLTPSRFVDATLNVKHVGGVETDRENTFALSPYTVVDAAVTWRRGPLRLTLSAHNLFDAAYYWNGDGETVDPGRPRQVLLTTAVTFKIAR